MAKTKKVPMGIEDFEEMRTMGYYYVDKTGLIRTLLENPGKVNLFTRPRRFGKTLNMSMLKYFFEAGSDCTLFDGLEISGEKGLCQEYLGKFPVISISLKNAEGDTLDKARKKFRSIIGNEAIRFSFLADSDRLNRTERWQYEKLIELDPRGDFAMSQELLENSLWLLSSFLHKHYGQKTVILIDEYDVPLHKAYQAGYYDAMADFIRALFGQALKTNGSLYFAVLTGCLMISKESIFTGLNNFKVYTIKDVRYKEYFGFTDAEVGQMLAHYNITSQYGAIKEWYDGYLFGNLGIYCPWDVMNYCGDLRDGSVDRPQNYWVNTSSNDIIRSFLGRANATTRNEIEMLMNGGSIKKMVHQELTYRDFGSGQDNLWSILFTTGYLTQRCTLAGDLTELVIPNREIRWIFTWQIHKWFGEETVRNTGRLEKFCRAFQENDAMAIENGFNDYLGDMISIRDTGAPKEMKENFYHGILLGILGNRNDWIVRSNAESGEGYSDISIEIRQKRIGIVIELKYARDAAFEWGCREALKQIRDKKYKDSLLKNGMETIYQYGIACYRKQCRVVSGPVTME